MPAKRRPAMKATTTRKKVVVKNGNTQAKKKAKKPVRRTKKKEEKKERKPPVRKVSPKLSANKTPKPRSKKAKGYSPQKRATGRRKR